MKHNKMLIGAVRPMREASITAKEWAMWLQAVVFEFHGASMERGRFEVVVFDCFANARPDIEVGRQIV